MRSTFAILLLMTLVSCVSKSEKSSCSLNRSEIPCGDEVVTSDNPNPAPVEEKVVTVILNSAIQYNSYEIEFLENADSKEEVEIEGEYKTCEVKTEALDRITYRVTSANLNLFKEKQYGGVAIESYERVSGNSNKIEGVWESKTRYPDRVEIIRLTIDSTTMKQEKECRF